MPRYIVHHKGWFFQWSTVTDSPLGYPALREEDFKNDQSVASYYDGHEIELAKDIAIAKNKGVSSIRYDSARELCGDFNRAGPDETSLSFEDILRSVKIPEEDIHE